MADNPYPPPYSPPPQSWPPPPGGYSTPPSYPPPAPLVSATTILVFGILGIALALTCGIGGVFGVVAWVMGNNALQTLDRMGDPLNQRTTVVAGRICGIVGTVLMALILLGLAALLVIGTLFPDKGS